MPVTEQQVRAHLEPEEPNYAAAAQLGPDALPVLEQLVRSADPLLASKAAYLASMIPDRRAAKVLEAAAQRDEPTVRVAAAAGLQRAPALAEEVAMDLIADQDPGVRKVALKSMRGKMTPALRARVENRAASESDPTLRSAYDAVLGRGETAEGETHDGGSAGGPGAGTEPGAAGEGGGDLGQGVTRGSSFTDVGQEGGGGGDLGGGEGSSRSGDGSGEGGGDVGGARGTDAVTAHGGGQL